MKKLIERFRTWLIVNRDKYEYWYEFIKMLVYYICLFFLINSVLGVFESLYYLKVNLVTVKFNEYVYETLEHLINGLVLYYIVDKLKEKENEK